VGERILWLLTNFWNSLTIVAKQSGYHGEPFKSERGTMQGDIVSPTIFNVVINAVVRAWHNKLEEEGLSDIVQAIFYADDGHLYSTNADALQRATNIIVDLFECMGLKTNPDKTRLWSACINPLFHELVLPNINAEWETTPKPPTAHGNDNKLNAISAKTESKHEA
jgi:hypothetical protein